MDGAVVTLWVLAAALLLDRFVGDPPWLWNKIAHPVALFGKAIDWADRTYNLEIYSDMQRERTGAVVIAVLMIAAGVLGWILSSTFGVLGWLGPVLEIVTVAVFLAQKSLVEHVSAVAVALRDEGLEGARREVSLIVGRSPETLDVPAVSRAAIESLAENASDGVVAPAFWYAVFGLPGLFVYKMLNTGDSMIAHRNDKYRAFGRACAKFDDLANWLPARLTGALLVAAGGMLTGLHVAKRGFETMLRDAGLHRSPNAGWPESAMAGVLGISLGGPRSYAGDDTDEPFMNDLGRKDIDQAEIELATGVFWRAMSIGTAFVLILALIF